VCLYTDGITEARVGSELYGAERLAEALAELGPATTASALLERVAEETSTRPDDMAACLLGVEGGEDAPSVQVEELELDRDEIGGDRIEQFLLACGVKAHDLPELTRAARAVAGRLGTVLVELRIGDGPPQVAFLRDKVAMLATPHISAPANVRMSR
jgi:hypothetical protein